MYKYIYIYTYIYIYIYEHLYKICANMYNMHVVKTNTNLRARLGPEAPNRPTRPSPPMGRFAPPIGCSWKLRGPYADGMQVVRE